LADFVAGSNRVSGNLLLDNFDGIVVAAIFADDIALADIRWIARLSGKKGSEAGSFKVDRPDLKAENCCLFRAANA